MRPGAKYLPVAFAALGLSIEAGRAAPELPVIAYQPGINPQTFLPISYQCPSGKNGIVEAVKMSPVGGRIRIRVDFEGETPKHASVQRARDNMPFESWHVFTTPTKRPDSEPERSIWQATLADADTIRLAICQGAPATREKYDVILEHNRQHMKPPPDN